jgi:hypothetical protein
MEMYMYMPSPRPASCLPSSSLARPALSCAYLDLMDNLSSHHRWLLERKKEKGRMIEKRCDSGGLDAHSAC